MTIILIEPFTILTLPRRSAEKWDFLKKTAFFYRFMYFSLEDALSCRNIRLPKFLQKSAVFEQHAAEGSRAQASRMLAYFHKIILVAMHIGLRAWFLTHLPNLKLCSGMGRQKLIKKILLLRFDPKTSTGVFNSRHNDPCRAPS